MKVEVLGSATEATPMEVDDGCGQYYYSNPGVSAIH